MRCGVYKKLVAYPFAALLLSALAGCGPHHYLAPAPTATRVPGVKDAATAQVAGVSLVVDGNAWSGNPSNLQQVMVPVEVEIQNGSDGPLRIRYSEFALLTAANLRVSPIPPYKIEGTIPGPPQPVTPAFAYGGFWLAPYYSRFYGPAFAPWPGFFPYDGAFYSTLWVSWPISLPTRTMLEKAIPEGVLQPGGHLKGFLYFPELGNGVKQVTFQELLVNADTSNVFGRIDIPLIRK